MKILLFSDIHQDWGKLQELLYYKDIDLFLCAGDWASFSRGVEEGINLMLQAKAPVWIIPGNNESLEDLRKAESMGLTSFHGEIKDFQGISIGGIGFSPPTPFNTPGEYSEEYFRKRLGVLEMCDSPDIFVSHCPPKNTSLDLTSSGHNVGSQAIREYIESHCPQYTFHGHIHECEGKVEKLYSSECRSIGKKGYLIEIEK